MFFQGSTQPQCCKVTRPLFQHCVSSVVEKMLATGFSFSLVLLFFIFSPFSLARVHSLCLIITFHDWLQHATCCPAESISFLTRCICWSRRGWHWGLKVPFFVKEIVSVSKPLQHTRKKEPRPGNRPPKTVNIHSRSDVYTLGEKDHFISTSAAAQGTWAWVEALL